MHTIQLPAHVWIQLISGSLVSSLTEPAYYLHSDQAVRMLASVRAYLYDKPECKQYSEGGYKSQVCLACGTTLSLKGTTCGCPLLADCCVCGGRNYVTRASYATPDSAGGNSCLRANLVTELHWFPVEFIDQVVATVERMLAAKQGI